MRLMSFDIAIMNKETNCFFSNVFSFYEELCLKFLKCSIKTWERLRWIIVCNFWLKWVCFNIFSMHLNIIFVKSSDEIASAKPAIKAREKCENKRNAKSLWLQHEKWFYHVQCFLLNRCAQRNGILRILAFYWIWMKWYIFCNLFASELLKFVDQWTHLFFTHFYERFNNTNLILSEMNIFNGIRS